MHFLEIIYEILSWRKIYNRKFYHNERQNNTYW